MSLLAVADLHHTYPDGMEVFHDVSFTLAEGERIALVGPNGAGKTTLLLRLAGLLWGKGNIAVDGTTLTRGTIRKLRCSIGITFQNPDDQLFCPTILDDIAYGLLQMGLSYDEAREKCLAMLEEFDLKDYAERSAYHLSVGERRRAALAAVLVMEPRLLLMDEPSAFLDPSGRRELSAALANLPQAMILATHDLEFARHLCPRTIVLHGRTIRADGETDALMSDARLMEETGLEVPWSLR
jgi:cobalt/nickel transport system ATP-binding protein